SSRRWWPAAATGQPRGRARAARPRPRAAGRRAARGRRTDRRAGGGDRWSCACSCYGAWGQVFRGRLVHEAIVGPREVAARRVEARVDGPHGNVEPGGDGVAALPLELVQDEHRALLGGEGIERRLHARERLALLGALARRA